MKISGIVTIALIGLLPLPIFASSRAVSSNSFDDWDNAINGTSQSTSTNTGNAGGPWTTPCDPTPITGNGCTQVFVITASATNWTNGTTSANNPLLIAKPIKITGNTVVNSTTGTSTDNTVIVDQVPKTTGGKAVMIKITAAADISGITIQGGSPRSPEPSEGTVQIIGADGFRFHGCHFISTYNTQETETETSYGVFDHNVWDFYNENQACLVYASAWLEAGGVGTRSYGDGSMVDPPNWNSDRFVFFEDNWFNNHLTAATVGIVAAQKGGRYQYRHNHAINCQAFSYGAEGRFHGGRAIAIYDNTFHRDSASGQYGQERGGTWIGYDNTWPDGVLIGGPQMTSFRASNTLGGTFGPSNGQNPWDVNDTNGDGTGTPNGTPYIYATGSAGVQVDTKTLTTPNQSWSDNQWLNYQLYN